MKKFFLLTIALIFTALNINATVNFTCNPAAGSTVESIKKVVISFPDAYGASWDDAYAIYENGIKNEAGEYLSSKSTLTWGPDESQYNQLTWEYGGTAITEAGTYTIVIPAGAITLSEDEMSDPVATTEDITFTLTVGSATAADPVLQQTYPQANTTVTALPDYMTFMFDQEIQQPYACAIQLDQNDPITIDPSDITVIDGNTVKFTLSEQVKAQLGKGGITAYVWLKEETQHYDTYFTVADEFGPVSNTLAAEGGKVVFNQNVDFVDYATEATCYVSTVKTKAIATQATLTLDDDDYTAIDVAFQDELSDGDYTLDIPAATIVSTAGEQYVGGSVAFTVSGGVATFVGVSPTEGEKVDLTTEYIVTFSKPVTYTTSLSDITVGQNPFGNGDGATFWMNDAKTEIHAKLDATVLAMYGITTVDQAVAKFGSAVALHVYKVKDEATGEALEYNDPDDEDQFTFTYKMGDPSILIQSQDGSSTTVTSLSTIYLACAEGIEVADGTQKITIANGKTIAYQTTAAELTAVAGEYGAPGYYSMTIDPAITAAGEYVVQIPAGTFTLGGTTLNKDTEETFTISASAPVAGAINVDPAPGVVESLKDFTFTYSNDGSAIMPCNDNNYNLTITNAEGTVVATITQDALYEGVDASSLNEYWDPTKINVSLDEAITAPGTYTLNIPASAFYLTDDYVNCEATTFTWTIESKTWTKTGYVMPISSWGTDTFWTDACAQEVTVSGTEGSNELTISQNSKGYYNAIYVTANDDETCASVSYDYDYYGWGYFDFGTSYCQYMNTTYCYAKADKDDGYVTLYGWFDNSDDQYYVDIEWYEGAKADAEAWLVAVGVKNVNAETENAPVYNIAGQRVNANAKGIVIKNGKKYLVK